MVRKIGEFEKSEVKSQRSTDEGSSYQAGRKNEDSRNGIPLCEVNNKSIDHFEEFNKH